MKEKGWIARTFLLVSIAALATALFAPFTAVNGRALAQEATPLLVSVPSIWENTLTPELLAEFEAENPGVKVHVVYNEQAFFGFGPGASDIDGRLDSTEESVSAADVVYVSSSSMTVEDTQAGYYRDLAPLVSSDAAIDPSDFYPAVWQSFQWDNGMWALPLSTDVILVTYNPAAFDAAGLAYPNERWTVDDFANAARTLTTYNPDGSVLTPGMSTLSGGNNQEYLLRALIGGGLYDASASPSAPSFANANLEYVLQTWYELRNEGVIAAQGGGLALAEDVPLTVSGVNGYVQRGFRPGEEQTTSTREASLLPGGVAGLSVQGFAVSAGTAYPELAYALARFLTSRAELASNFFSASPARISLAQDASASNNAGTNGQQGGAVIISGPGGGQGVVVGGSMGSLIPDTIRPVFEQGLYAALPASAMRYSTYLSTILSEMDSNGGDARSALQTVEAQAVSDTQTAQARKGTRSLFVAAPPVEPTLAAGKVALNCALSLGFGGGPGGRSGDMPNQDLWDQVVADFLASDPDVGLVNLESVMDSDLATLAQEYDCIILNANAVADADLSAILNLDPLIDTDMTFDRNDVIGNTMAQLQRDNKTWALPLSIQPSMLEYDVTRFAQAGVPEPLNGWTTEQFIDALKMLKPYDSDPVPFQPNDPSGSYLMMLIAAFGGLPVDYRTTPPTINFTDPATVDAIRQVLDLAKAGYIDYSPLGQTFAFQIGGGESPAITTTALSQLRRMRFQPPGASDTQTETAMVAYPQGSAYNVAAYEITTGYISASAQNPDAAYRFLSLVARNPQLFSGMPARASLVSDPDVIAAQGQDMTAAYQQLDALLRDPNTLIFPTFSLGRGGTTSLASSIWLNQAMDSYIEDEANLETALADAQMTTQAYMDCVAAINVDTTDAMQARGEQFEQMMNCMTTVDPDLTMQ
ncbi:MAG: extracellular solute-binding protein [Anaerolineae bacterium]|nr:extracellular solute-binding protein [Anaerolineae bacterium]